MGRCPVSPDPLPSTCPSSGVCACADVPAGAWRDLRVGCARRCRRTVHARSPCQVFTRSSLRRPSTWLPRSSPWVSVPLQETPNLSRLLPDLSTEVGDVRWKGKAMVRFSARKEICGGEDSGGDRDTELQCPRLLPRMNRWGKLRAWDILLAMGPSLIDSRSRYIVSSNITIDLCCGTHLCPIH
jgi:hypothetical protein